MGGLIATSLAPMFTLLGADMAIVLWFIAILFVVGRFVDE
jgi:hypothetical protein